MTKFLALVLFSVLVPVVIHGRLWKNVLDDVLVQLLLGVAVVVCPRHPQALGRLDDHDSNNTSTWDHVCVQDHHDLAL